MSTARPGSDSTTKRVSAEAVDDEPRGDPRFLSRAEALPTLLDGVARALDVPIGVALAGPRRLAV
jgi:hypothetical protein